MKEKKRENWIDFLKLIAMMIVVMNHACCTVPLVSFWGGMFFVPVFFVLSGYTYHFSSDSFGKAVSKKAKRLLRPYFAANGVLFAFFLLKDVVLSQTRSISQMLQSIWGILYARNQVFSLSHPTFMLSDQENNIYLLTNLNAPTWFLPALFVTILMFEGLSRLFEKDIKKLWLTGVIGVLCGVLYYYICPILLPWSLDAVPFFYLMFLIGYTLQVCDGMDYLNRHHWIIAPVVFGLLIGAYLNGSTNFSIAVYGKSVTLALYNAVSSSVLMMLLCRMGQKLIPDWLGKCGRQTLFVLCYHMLILSVITTVIPNLPLFVTVLLTMFLLILFGIAKERALLFVKKEWQRRRDDAKK